MASSRKKVLCKTPHRLLYFSPFFPSLFLYLFILCVSMQSVLDVWLVFVCNVWSWHFMGNNSLVNSFALFAILSLGPPSNQIIFYPSHFMLQKHTKIWHYTHTRTILHSVFDEWQVFYSIEVEKREFFDLNQTKFLSVVDECRVLYIFVSAFACCCVFCMALPFLTFSYIIEFQARIHSHTRKNWIA